jgi:hypothetical protein
MAAEICINVLRLAKANLDHERAENDRDRSRYDEQYSRQKLFAQ